MKRFIYTISVALVIGILACAPTVLDKDVDSSETTDRMDPQVKSGLSEVYIAVGEDVSKVFKTLSSDVKKITFEPGDHVARDTLHLPRTGGLVIIDGNGADLKLGNMGFYSMPRNKDEAMLYNHTRYLIRNFSTITGGEKGVMLGSSFNTVIENIEFVGQKETAIDLIFCLMCTIENVLVTNNFHDGIVLRTGRNVDSNEIEWDRAGVNNSQCNHTEVRSCRVYNRKGCTGTSFKVLQSSGVRLVNCISEGWPNKRAVYFDALKATTAKYFSIENFHLEHIPSEGGLCFRNFGSLIEVDGFFVQKGSVSSPVIRIENNGSYVFRNFPYWPDGAWIASSNSPSVVMENCPVVMYSLDNYWTNMEREGEKVFKGYFKTDKMLRP
jgi:hypothetical protein